MKSDRSPDDAASRRAANARAKTGAAAKPPPAKPPSEGVRLRRLQQELETHQLQLERQNEELRAAHAEIKAGLERFTDLFDFAPVGYVNLTDDGTIRLANLAGATLLGLERGQLLGRRFQTFLAEADQAAFSALLHSVFTTRARQTCEIALARHGRSPVFIHFEATLAPDGKRCRAVMLDVTERKQAEAAAHTSEERLIFALQTIHTGAWDLDLRDHTAHRTQLHDQIFGYPTPPPQWSYETFLEHVLPEDRPEVERRFREATAAQSDWNFECRIRRADGEVRWIFAAGSHQRDADGNPVRMAGVVQDVTERKRTEAALRESEERFHTLVNAMPQLAWLARADGHLFWFNRRWYDYTGTTPEEMEGWGWQKVHCPVALPKVLEQWKTSIATGEAFEMTFPLRGADGGFRQFLTRAVPLKDADGRVLEWLGTNTDVDEIKRIEQTLTENELRFHLATEATGVGVWEWNVLTNRIRWDNQMFNIYGIAPTETGFVDYAVWSEAVLPEDRPKQEEILQDTVRRGGSSSRAFRIRRRTDGECRDIHASETTRRNIQGQVEWVVGTNLDVTERKRAEEAGVRMAAIVQSCDDAIIGKTLEGIITSWNPGAEKLFGYAAAEIIGQSVMRLIPPERQAEEPDFLARVGRGETVDHYETVRVRKDGMVIDVSVTISPIRDANGRIIGASKIARDITERKRAAERFRAVVESSPNAIVLVNRAGAITMVNAQTEKMFGYERAELVGQSVELLVPAHARARHPGHRERFFAHPSARQMGAGRDLFGLHKDGHEIPVEIGLNPMEMAEGPFVLASIIDITERKRAEAALRASEISYRRLFEAAKDGILILEAATGEIFDANPFLCNLLGYSRAEMIGKRVWEISHFKDIAANETKFLELQERGFIRYENLPLETADGRRVEVEFVSNVYAVNNHQVIQCNIRDITERKQAEAELNRMKNLLAEGQRLAHLGSWEYIAETRGTLWSEEQLRLYGLDPAGPSPDYQTMLRNHIHPEDAAWLDETFRQCLQDHTVYEQEHRIVHPDGSVRVVQELARPWFDDHGKLVKYVGATLDVTERKQAEISLRTSQALYSSLVDHLPVGMFRKDAAGRFDYVNSLFCEIKGLKREEILGHTALELAEYVRAREAHADSRDSNSYEHMVRGEEHHAAIMKTGQSIEADENYRTADGRDKFFHVLKTPVFDSENKVVGSQGIMLDISTRMQAEAEIHRLNAELERRVLDRTAELTVVNKELEAFAYSVSHDLRAPLRAIDGFSRIVLEDCAGQLNEAGRENLQRVRAASQRMGHLIDDMLQLSRLTRSDMHLLPVDLSALARAVADELQKTEPGRPVEFVIEPGLTAEADAGLMHAVMENLLGNAWKFTGKQAAPRIEFGRTTRDGQPAYFVRDNGVGFDMTYAGKLFGAFQRLHASTDFPGTGVGLATVQRVIHRHNGRVWAESEAGHGATFYFTLQPNYGNHEQKKPTPA